MPSLLPGKFGLSLIGETLAFLIDPISKSRILGAKFLLSSGFDNFSWREGYPEIFHKLLGRSLFAQKDEEHRRNQRLIMPDF
ncbi:hypothetical protein ACQ4M3_35950 [Leptolyngbya sp. AN03gr2]|uniref:hypothetical protein n=1 Tax=unclassified Leptolyngbya TaxID=2650499 RepID=UPI003D323A91